ncbi:MFS transporter [Nanchangia anserum]|uniref:MFS transporter n=1 Tax=Nanchangia anserum TaxID=2692125 RepID=A0A8I0GBG4_9ACTO|nr:MFS transporter [Nanchangia anserum]MBD3689713.1 MFS transporter [Nanchangia anserum]QOX81887.1 MFS transporter [Nanchangia anserum]
MRAADSRSVKPAWILAVVASSSFLATFNETFLNVALTPIMGDFSLDAATGQWVTTAYMLVAAVVVPLTGFLYRSIATRRLVLISLGLLLVGSLVGVIAPTFPILVAARVIQAIGTGMVVPIGMNLTLAVAPPHKLGIYMGIVSAMTTLGPAFGPIVAGGIMSLTSWHGLFAVFAVMIVLVIILSLVAVKDIAELTKPRLDAASVILASVGLIGLMYGSSILFKGQALLGAVIAVVGIIVIAAFLVRQRRCAHPLLNLAPLMTTGFNLGVLLVVIALMTVFSLNMILPVFMQSALGFTPMVAALTLLPPCLVSCVLAPVAGKIFDKFGVRIMVPVGMFVVFASMVVLSRLDETATSAMVIACYAPAIAGCAMVVGPSQSHALSRLTPDLYPHGTTIVGTAFQLAGCFGSALFMGVYSLAEQNSRATALVAAADGFHAATLVACGVTFVGFLVALGMAREAGKRRVGDHHDEPAAHHSAAESATPRIHSEATAQTVMQKEVFSVDSTASAYDALTLMARKRTSGMPVIGDNDTLVGFVTDGALLRALSGEGQDAINMAYVYALWAQEKDLSGQIERLKDIPVMDVAFRRPVSVDADASLQDVCEALSDRHVKKVPVLDNGRLVGVINRTELLRTMVPVV